MIRQTTIHLLLFLSLPLASANAGDRELFALLANLLKFAEKDDNGAATLQKLYDSGPEAKDALVRVLKDIRNPDVFLAAAWGLWKQGDFSEVIASRREELVTGIGNWGISKKDMSFSVPFLVNYRGMGDGVHTALINIKASDVPAFLEIPEIRGFEYFIETASKQFFQPYDPRFLMVGPVLIDLLEKYHADFPKEYWTSLYEGIAPRVYANTLDSKRNAGEQIAERENTQKIFAQKMARMLELFPVLFLNGLYSDEHEIQTLRKIGEPATEFLVAWLQQPESFKNDDTLQSVLSILMDMAMFHATAFSQSDITALVHTLDMEHVKNTDVVSKIIAMLGWIGRPAVEPLKKLLLDDTTSSMGQKNGLRAVIEIGEMAWPLSLHFTYLLTNSENASLKILIHECFAVLENEHVPTMLNLMRQSENETEKYYAAKALVRSNAWQNEKDWKEILTTLQEIAKNKIMTLGKGGIPVSQDAMVLLAHIRHSDDTLAKTLLKIATEKDYLRNREFDISAKSLLLIAEDGRLSLDFFMSLIYEFEFRSEFLSIAIAAAKSQNKLQKKILFREYGLMDGYIGFPFLMQMGPFLKDHNDLLASLLSEYVGTDEEFTKWLFDIVKYKSHDYCFAQRVCAAKALFLAEKTTMSIAVLLRDFPTNYADCFYGPSGIFTLAKPNSREHKAVLLYLLQTSKRVDERIEMARVLGNNYTHDRVAISGLIKSLNTPDTGFHNSVITALGNSGEVASEAILETIAKRSVNLDALESLIYALGRTHTENPAAKTELEKLIKHSNFWVRIAAEQALAQLTND